jgi:hypothetical protein
MSTFCSIVFNPRYSRKASRNSLGQLLFILIWSNNKTNDTNYLSNQKSLGYVGLGVKLFAEECISIALTQIFNELCTR